MRKALVASTFVLCLIGTTTAVADVRTFELAGVTFTDGGTATGTINYDTVTLSPVNWSIAIAGGDTATFPPVTMTPSNSTGQSYKYDCDPQTTLIFQLKPPSQRQLRITPTEALATSTGSVPVDLATCSGGSAGVECFGCTPYRLINAGEFELLQQVPVLGTYGLAVLAALLAGVGVALLVRRRFA